MKLTIYILLALSLTAFFSCSLKEEPYGFYTSDNFYQTEADAESGLMYAYVTIPSYKYFSASYLYATSLITEELSLKPDASVTQHDLDQISQDGMTNTETEQSFMISYLIVGRANTLIESLPNISMNESYRNQMLGEAYFLRAYGYFNLVRLFGKVPLRLSTLDSFDNVGAPLASIKNIYEQSIIPDLKKAESLMDDQVRRARANKFAAKGLLSSAYLFLASAKESGLEGYEFTSSADEYYALAADKAKEVVYPEESNGFGRDDDYFKVFNTADETSSELIFYVVSSITTVGSKNLASTLTSPYCAQQNFTLGSEFGNTSTGYGWNHVHVELPFYRKFSATDKRKRAFFYTEITSGGNTHRWEDDPSGNTGGTMYVNDAVSSEGYIQRPYISKYIDNDSDGDTGNRHIIVRYSDILLVYAEAMGLSNEGIEALNVIRRGAGISEYQLSDFSSDKEFRAAVVEERSKELCYEFNRIYDLRRTKGFEDMAEEYGKTLVKNYYFYEIPQSEFDNNPAL